MSKNNESEAVLKQATEKVSRFQSVGPTDLSNYDFTMSPISAANIRHRFNSWPLAFLSSDWDL
jgi:hypothetical protein